MEALSGVFKHASSLGIYEGIKCGGQGPSLTHLLYADDVVFFGAWTSRNALNIKRILRCFYLASGLKINLGKSSLYGIGAGESEIAEMASLLKCKVGSFPFKHLGLTIGANMNVVKHWKPVVELFKTRLTDWKARNLSSGGRITLMKSVLNSLPTYFFSLYRAPAQVIDQLEQLRRRFFWGGSDSSKICWVAWDKAMLPKENGGLGIGSLREANLALLAKWWWRFKTEKQCLWRKIIWSLHSSSRTWSFIPVKLTSPGPWKQVLKSANELQQLGVDLKNCIRAVIGAGLDIFFWFDCWIGNEPLAARFPALFLLEAKRNRYAAERLTVKPTGVSCTFHWKRLPSSVEELDQHRSLCILINSAQISSSVDRWSWTLDGSGSFSVRSLKRHLHQNGSPIRDNLLPWNNWVPKKLSIFAWQAQMGRIPSRMALAARNVNVETVRCPFCGEDNETAEHLLISCRFAQLVWEKVSTWCKIRSIYAFSIDDLLSIHVSCPAQPSGKKQYIPWFLQQFGASGRNVTISFLTINLRPLN